MALKLPVPKIPKDLPSYKVSKWLAQPFPVQRWIADRLARGESGATKRLFNDYSSLGFGKGGRMYDEIKDRGRRVAESEEDDSASAFPAAVHSRVGLYPSLDDGSLSALPLQGYEFENVGTVGGRTFAAGHYGILPVREVGDDFVTRDSWDGRNPLSNLESMVRTLVRIFNRGKEEYMNEKAVPSSGMEDPLSGMYDDRFDIGD